MHRFMTGPDVLQHHDFACEPGYHTWPYSSPETVSLDPGSIRPGR